MKKLKGDKEKEVFYNNLVKSINKEEDMLVQYCRVVESDELSNAVVEKKIKEISDIIKEYKRMGVFYYCQLGNELAKYKSLYYKRCDECINSANVYSELSCSSCQKPGNKLFLDKVKDITDYGKSHINFLIDLSKLACIMRFFSL